MKKKYTSPVITRIKLDPSQAILQACKTGGAYMTFNVTRCVGTAYSHNILSCQHSVRGSQSLAANRTIETSSTPS